MGSSETIVAINVVVPEPPLTRLPSLTFLSEIRPAIGALTSVHSKLSWADLLCRLGDLQLRLRNGKIGRALIVVAPRDSVRSDKRLGALDIGGGDLDLSRSAGDLGFGALHGDGERPLVDGEKEITLFDGGPVNEVHLVDEA